MSSYEKLLKQATAAKRRKDFDGAIALIDQALAKAPNGAGARPQIHKKRIGYALLAGRTQEAFESATRILQEAPEEAFGDPALIGTQYSFGYRERARTLNAMGKSEEAALDYVRAQWHWHQAMQLQGRTGSEHTLERAAESLSEELEGCGGSLLGHRVLEILRERFGEDSPELAVDAFRMELGKQGLRTGSISAEVGPPTSKP